jgi:hypothetical protein
LIPQVVTYEAHWIFLVDGRTIHGSSIAGKPKNGHFLSHPFLKALKQG